MKKQKFYKAIIIKGRYTGETGKATPANEMGHVMFYPDSEVCYRICKKLDEIQYKE